MHHPTATHETPEDLLDPVAATTTNWIPDLPLDDTDACSAVPSFLQFESDSHTSPPAQMMTYPDAAMSWISWLEGSGYSRIMAGLDYGGNDTFLLDRVAPCTGFESQSSGSVSATARRGRARKNALITCLETSVRELEAEKLELITRVAVLQSEADTFREKDDDLTRRVAILEERLVETLRALLEQG
ncbi:hypothetical protein HDU98_002226 [Podochytrium sp. JEL0797]|nr:hypothetical protein HDU98_002226 [Podochytrium sp. JEL0797]